MFQLVLKGANRYDNLVPQAKVQGKANIEKGFQKGVWVVAIGSIFSGMLWPRPQN